MAKKELNPEEFKEFFNDVSNGVLGTEKGGPKNFRDAFLKYDLEIPSLPPPFDQEISIILDTDFQTIRQDDTKKVFVCSLCPACNFCLFCGEVNYTAGAVNIGGIATLAPDVKKVSL
jgi:hypothetical protein